MVKERLPADDDNNNNMAELLGDIDFDINIKQQHQGSKNNNNSAKKMTSSSSVCIGRIQWRWNK